MQGSSHSNLELMAYRDYTLKDASLQYWRSQSQFEVDFVVNESLAIEVKATSRVADRDLKGLKALEEDTPMQRRIVVSGESARRTIDGIEIIPYGDFLTDLWSHQIITN
jgi:predicted AAA+ superfamily ATPase